MIRLGTRLIVAALLAWGVAVAAPAGAATGTVVRITFSGTRHGQPITTVDNEGSGSTTQAVVTANGGALLARWSGIRSGVAARYPSYDGRAGGARAVVAVTSSGGPDDLSPGAAEFTFGADARIDTTSRGTPKDNGNNLVQRGLATQPAQYKLQLDGRRFSCRVKGDQGALFVTSSLRTRTRTWYHALCRRRIFPAGDRLVLKVARIHHDGSRGPVHRTVSRAGSVGALSFDAATPFSIGGKLKDAATIATASDQWNGLVDNAFLTIRP